MVGLVQRQARRLIYGFVVFLVAWGLAGVVRLLASPGPLTIRVTPQIGFAPLALMVDLHLIPEAEDRVIWLTSDPYITGSEIPLQGMQSSRTHHRVWRVSEPGKYMVRAEVGHGLWKRAYAVARVEVR